MAKYPLTENRSVRPSLDRGAPWASNASMQARMADKSRSVVYCVFVEGLELIKIGRTAHLKSRMASLRGVVGRQLHIGYWAEFHSEDAKAVERCALLRMRCNCESEGEWSIATTRDGASAISSAAGFLGITPVFEAGDPLAHEPVDQYSYLRENKSGIKKRANNTVDRDYWGDPYVVDGS